MGTATRFWNWHAERYSRQAIADEASYRKKLAITQKYLTPEMRVVELGCGTGSTAVLHAPKVREYHGIDVSEKMVEIARRKADEAGLSNLRFTAGTLEQAGVAPESCDVVLGLNILHLVPDLEGTLATVASLLKPGGRFIHSTICAKELGGSLGWIARATRWIPGMPTVRPFTGAELESILTRAGFTTEERFEPHRGVLFMVTSKA